MENKKVVTVRSGSGISHGRDPHCNGSATPIFLPSVPENPVKLKKRNWSVGVGAPLPNSLMTAEENMHFEEYYIVIVDYVSYIGMCISTGAEQF